ncbi:MAG: CocE/NonD family hydrolase, partial [Myxococcales bacterium]|nr:CocE/NonD family hydrolase [Myxococcales bacterium]
ELRYAQGVALWYVPGEEGWRLTSSWPPKQTWVTRHLGQGTGARCAGVLQEAPSAGGRWTWVHDPDDPVPTQGGAGMLAGALPLFPGAKVGFRRDRVDCARREDVLSFASTPQDEAFVLAGSPRAELRITSDARAGAVVLRVLERRADGREILVREGGATFHTVDDATPVDVTVSTVPVAWTFGAGSRVVVEVTSSSFPKFESHAGVPERWDLATETRTSTHTLWLPDSRVSWPIASPAPGRP